MANHDPVELMLRAVRQRALRSALMATLPASAWACHPPGIVPQAMPVKPTDPPPMQPSVAPPEVAVEQRVQCDEASNFPISARNLRPIVPVDYLAVRRTVGLPNQGNSQDWTETRFEVVDQWGTPCSSAPAGSDCSVRVAHHPAALENPQCVQICSEISLVTTRGGDVRRWATAAKLREFLAPIDTVDEALLLAQAEHYNVSCEAESTKARRTVGGYEVYATRLTSSCSPMIVTGYWLRVSDTGEVSEISSEERSRSEACVGRMPHGLLPRAIGSVDRAASAEQACADYLAESAYLEAVSVLAFERLARELAGHGAPAHLVEAALRAREEEVLHAREVRALAGAFGARSVDEPRLEPECVRELAAVALENAVEGCIRETYGAMVGALQGVQAADPAVQHGMRDIAEEELSHAALSHRVHAWLMPRLDVTTRHEINAAMRRAIRDLRSDVLSAAGKPELERALGLPSAVEADALLRQLSNDVWSPLLERTWC